MKASKLALLGAVFLITMPVFADTYFGGVEDWSGLDYDYNDIVFSIGGSGLNLHSATGKWFAEPLLGTSQTPFWNRSSLDGANYNVGYCIYGGGSCNGGVGLAAADKYLATTATTTGSANDAYFSSTGTVYLNIALEVTDAKDSLGWYSVSDPSKVNWLSSGQSFTPAGAFGLVAKSQGANPNDGFTYFSQFNYGSQDNVSHFAFFGAPSAVAPEPSAVGLVALGLFAAGIAYTRRRRVTAN